MNLSHPVHFVAPQEVVWPELRNWDGTMIAPEILTKRSGGILHSWILRTYYQLRLAGAPVTLSSDTRPDAINFASVRDFGRRQRKVNAFLVIPQGDAHDTMLADHRIRQNGLFAQDTEASVIWHWPQPGIIARDPARGSKLSRLSYKGRLLNLDASLQSDAFKAELATLGVEFEIDAYAGLRGEHSWNDYHTADAALAVRNLTVYDARKKPASKLVNAWFADVPAILGPEPAYQELRQSKYDYLEVRTPGDVLEAVRMLKSDPAFFDAMIRNGRERRKSFSEPALTALWLEQINGPIAARFEHWKTLPSWRRALNVYAGMMREKGSKARDLHGIRNGPRLLEADLAPELSK